MTMIYDNHETLPSILLISYVWNDYVACQTPLFYVPDVAHLNSIPIILILLTNKIERHKSFQHKLQNRCFYLDVCLHSQPVSLLLTMVKSAGHFKILVLA